MKTLDIHEIKNLLPHRYPFLLVDRVTESIVGEKLIAIKNVTVNEPFFEGHFPHRPVMPGVLILEAMAQTSAVLAFKSLGGYPPPETLYLLVGIDAARFKKQVVPGDQMIIDADVIKERRGIWKFQCEARVSDTLCCSAEVLIAKNEIEL